MKIANILGKTTVFQANPACSLTYPRNLLGELTVHSHIGVASSFCCVFVRPCLHWTRREKGTRKKWSHVPFWCLLRDALLSAYDVNRTVVSSRSYVSQFASLLASRPLWTGPQEIQGWVRLSWNFILFFVFLFFVFVCFFFFSFFFFVTAQLFLTRIAADILCNLLSERRMPKKSAKPLCLHTEDEFFLHFLLWGSFHTWRRSKTTVPSKPPIFSASYALTFIAVKHLVSSESYLHFTVPVSLLAILVVKLISEWCDCNREVNGWVSCLGIPETGRVFVCVLPSCLWADCLWGPQFMETKKDKSLMISINEPNLKLFLSTFFCRRGKLKCAFLNCLGLGYFFEIEM